MSSPAASFEVTESLAIPTDGGDPAIMFMGKKRRRHSSCAKSFQGDYLNLASHAVISKMLAKSGDKEILFADMVTKVNKRFKMQERILLITTNYIYNIDPSNYKVKRKIAICEVASISTSTLADNFFAIHVTTAYDYLLVSRNKIEIMLNLMMQYELQSELQLPVHFQDRYEYKVEPGSASTIREVVCSLTDGGVTTQIRAKAKT